MKIFTGIILRLLLAPMLWLAMSLAIQRLVYNPIGNPEIKSAMTAITDDAIYFIGPSTIHNRIDQKLLETEWNKTVHCCTSMGQSTLESLVIQDLVKVRTNNAKILFAAQDLPISSKGFHQCWPCSNLPIPIILAEWREISSCFWFDATLGLFASFIPPKMTYGYASSDEELLAEENIEWHEEFMKNQKSVIEEMTKNYLSRNNHLTRKHLFELIADDSETCLIEVPNGKFQKLPLSNTICLLDSTWLDAQFWLDKGHCNHVGSMKFNQALASSQKVKEWIE